MSTMDGSTLQIQTEKWLRIVQFGQTARGLPWKNPLPLVDLDTDGCCLDGVCEYVAEWWSGTEDDTKGLTVWFNTEEIYYIKSDMDRLDDGYVICPQDIGRLLVWLLHEKETA